MSVISLPKSTAAGSPGDRLRAVLAAVCSAELVLGVAGACVILSYAFLACAHVNDRFQVDFVSGVYAALAQRLNQGVFYPELYDGAHYGGTRYMPLSIVLHAGVARLTGEYLIAGKLITYTLTAALCGQLFLILRWLGCARGAALGLSSLVLVTRPGFLASTTIRGDLLPVVLQLAALMIVCKTSSMRGIVSAALLCTLAVLTKITAVWAVPAIVCTYWPAGRRRFGVIFVVVWLGSLLGGFYLCQVFSEGRLFENLQALAGSGLRLRALLRAPNAFLAAFGGTGLVTGMIVPVLALAGYRALVQRRWTLFHSAAVCSFLILLVIFADMRTVYNHALDLVALGIVLAGCLWVELPNAEFATVGTRFILAVVVGWLALAGWAGTMENRIREVADSSWRGATTSYPRVPLATQLPVDGAILSEDPWVAIARGRTPTLLDPDSFARLSESRPDLTAPLLQRVRGGEFARIVLLNRVDSPPTADYRWQDVNLGWPLVRAIADRYELATTADGFFVYAPKTDPE